MGSRTKTNSEMQDRTTTDVITRISRDQARRKARRGYDTGVSF